ncbi:SAM-dependent methyltransferase [Streptomyces telluris]|uniref:Class I SAM-dependent methyltransferase n=1 Tax=Streptomyces telluris TaxID=2720021 RepID=A0A9X2LL53_9ACTN|nr:class I SAM-dependent methyltransferase [Streptomyces telluris]MCQ8772946.1 class I SAM-dependent methyltransferase [Streptomyces telluris]NJP79223.1 hypothetical protein [Streptomyces telluris]
MLCHPGTDDIERLLAPARCTLAAWALDDHYCDDPGLGAAPALAGARPAIAAATVDGLYHHPYGIGPYDPGVLEGPASADRDQRIVDELHRLESAQADLFLDHPGPLPADARVLDAGSGRGGTGFMAHRRFGCRVDGVTISEYQAGFANEQAEERGVADRA